MFTDSLLLYPSAISIGIVHVLVGPDHYVPFIALARARKWTMGKTLGLTLASGVAHVLGSILIGLVGIYLGKRFLGLEIIEATRGDVAAWLLFGFGLAYMLWGIRRALRRREQSDNPGNSLVFWSVFIIFALGPCEPLIPLLMTPAAAINSTSLVLVSALFLIATVSTMLVVVALGYVGAARLRFEGITRYAHALAGGAMTSCAAAMLYLGL